MYILENVPWNENHKLKLEYLMMSHKLMIHMSKEIQAHNERMKATKKVVKLRAISSFVQTKIIYLLTTYFFVSLEE